MEIFLYLCSVDSTLGQSALCGWGWQTYYYRRLSTLCSDILKLRNFQKQIRNLATLDVLRVYYINTLGRGAYLCVSILGIIIYQRGLRVVVLICWAMREPHDVERQLSSSTFFFVPFFTVGTHGSCVRSMAIHLFFYINEYYNITVR